jgi:protein SCO1/2
MKQVLLPSLLLAALFATGVGRVCAQALPGDSVYHVDAQVTTSQGQTQAWRALRGQTRVVSMFYSGCHVMCPLILENAKAVQKQLSPAERERLGLVMISLDPIHDTPAVLAQTARNHRLPANWQLLRPGVDEVRALASVLDVRYRARDDGSINHTSVLILLDADGRILARSDVATAAPDPAFVAAVRQAVRVPVTATH